MGALNADQRAEVIGRIGWLNVFSPLKPDGAYSLDLSRREDRLVLKMLIHLDAAESRRKVKGWADNPDPVFQRARADGSFESPVIGWKFPKAWLSKSGLEKTGRITIRYDSSVNLEVKKRPKSALNFDDLGKEIESPKKQPKNKKRTIDRKTAERLQQSMQKSLHPKGATEPLNLGKIFRSYDATGDGTLDAVELTKLLRKDLGILSEEILDEEVGALVKALDDDGSGTLSIHELLDFVERGYATFNSGPLKLDPAVATALQEAMRAALTNRKFFGRFDASGDGQLDAAELARLVRGELAVDAERASDAELQTLVELLDDDRSGTLSTDELADFVEHGTECFAVGRRERMNAATCERLQGALREATTYTSIFRRFDASGDGLLDSGELAGLIRQRMHVPPDAISDEQVCVCVCVCVSRGDYVYVAGGCSRAKNVAS